MLHSHSRNLRLCGGIIAGLALFCAGAGLPLTQMVRVQETREFGEDQQFGAAQYKIVLASTAQKQAESNPPDQPAKPETNDAGQETQSRLFKPLADHWESSPTVKLPDLHIDAVTFVQCVEPRAPKFISAIVVVRPLSRDTSPPTSRGPPVI